MKSQVGKAKNTCVKRNPKLGRHKTLVEIIFQIEDERGY